MLIVLAVAAAELPAAGRRRDCCIRASAGRWSSAADRDHVQTLTGEGVDSRTGCAVSVDGLASWRGTLDLPSRHRRQSYERSRGHCGRLAVRGLDVVGVNAPEDTANATVAMLRHGCV